MFNLKILAFFSSLLSMLFISNHASADSIGRQYWGLNLREPFSGLMAEMYFNGLLWLITIISLFVLALLVIIVVKFNAKANPKPSKTTHNTS